METLNGPKIHVLTIRRARRCPSEYWLFDETHKCLILKSPYLGILRDLAHFYGVAYYDFNFNIVEYLK